MWLGPDVSSGVRLLGLPEGWVTGRGQLASYVSGIHQKPEEAGKCMNYTS